MSIKLNLWQVIYKVSQMANKIHNVHSEDFIADSTVQKWFSQLQVLGIQPERLLVEIHIRDIKADSRK